MNQGVCQIVGAGDFSLEELAPSQPGDLLIAADRGYAALQAGGVRPDWVVGDFDSLGAPPDFPHVLQHPVEKDDTDMLLAVRVGLERGYRRFRLYGSLGGERLDHTLANLQTLRFLQKNGASGSLIGGGQILTLLSNGSRRFSPEHHGVLSVFALGTARGVSETGLHYSLHDAVLTDELPLGVSNEFIGREAVVSVEDGTLLLYWRRLPQEWD